MERKSLNGSSIGEKRLAKMPGPKSLLSTSAAAAAFKRRSSA